MLSARIHRGLFTFGKIKTPSVPNEDGEPGNRAECFGFSLAARRACLRFVNKIDRDDLPVFVTLTYREFVEDFEVWKKHLNKYLTYLRRTWNVSGVWKLEFQRRGAPHFHLVLWFDDLRPYEPPDPATVAAFSSWSRETWVKIVGDDDLDFWKKGSLVEVANSRDHVLWYVGGHMFKNEQNRVDIKTGKCWGVINRDKLEIEPISTTDEFQPHQYFFIRRILRSYLKKKGAGPSMLRSLKSGRFRNEQTKQWEIRCNELNILIPSWIAERLLELEDTKNPF